MRILATTRFGFLVKVFLALFHVEQLFYLDISPAICYHVYKDKGNALHIAKGCPNIGDSAMSKKAQRNEAPPTVEPVDLDAIVQKVLPQSLEIRTASEVTLSGGVFHMDLTTKEGCVDAIKRLQRADGAIRTVFEGGYFVAVQAYFGKVATDDLIERMADCNTDKMRGKLVSTFLDPLEDSLKGASFDTLKKSEQTAVKDAIRLGVRRRFREQSKKLAYELRLQLTAGEAMTEDGPPNPDADDTTTVTEENKHTANLGYLAECYHAATETDTADARVIMELLAEKADDSQKRIVAMVFASVFGYADLWDEHLPAK